MSNQNLSREQRLKKIFDPKTIAVVGATTKKESVGYHIFKNLINNEYEGIVYPVNLHRNSILGVKAYSTLESIPDDIDLVIIATPARTVPDVLEQCGQQGVGGVVLVSAGFEEAGEDGKEFGQRVKDITRKYSMPLVGPNCLGFLRPSKKINASFAAKMPTDGKIAFISQSGALGTSIIDWAVEHNVGMRYFVSIGEMADIGFHDMIDYFGKDPETKSILIYMESLKDARQFMSAARAFARSKPIIVLKSGTSSEGAKAAASHTGSLAGNDKVFDAAFKRAGVLRVNTIEELFACAKALSMQKLPHGNRLAIVTNAGGPGVIATDQIIKKKCKIAKLSNTTMEKLNGVLPPMWSHNNPIDVLGDASAERFKIAVEACCEDINVDGILVILTPQAMTDPDEVARELVNIKTHKTLMGIFMGEEAIANGLDIMRKGGIPAYKMPEDAVNSFAYMYEYSKNIELLYETPATIPHALKPNTEDNARLIEQVISEGRDTLRENEVKLLLQNYGIPVQQHKIVHNANEAMEHAKELGFPVVMKIHSDKILHKTDLGGVVLNVTTPEAARQAYEDIVDSVNNNYKDENGKTIGEIGGKFTDVIIEPMINKKYELLIGCKKDPIFGPVIVFGMGGVAVEVYEDTNVGLPPLNMALSMRLIEGTKIFKLLKGYRNMPGVDLDSIQFLLYKFAYLVMDFPEIKEIDINPFSVDINGGVVLDAKVILDKEAIANEVKPYSHLVISPYPKEYRYTAKLKNGQEVNLRPIRPEDEEMEAEMFQSFSEETQRYRFFTLIKDVTHELLVRYTQIDYDREMAVIAEVEEHGKKKMAGVARVISEPYGDRAEFAIVVADPWHNQGLGNILMDTILQIAKERKIQKVYAYFLTDNFVMKHMFEKRGFDIKNKDDSYYAEKIV